MEGDHLQTRPAWTRRSLLRSGLLVGLVGAGMTGALLGACSSPTPPAASAPTAAKPAGTTAPPAAGATTAPAAGTTAPAASTSGGTPTSGGVLVAGWEEDAANLDPTKLLCAHESRMAELFAAMESK